MTNKEKIENLKQADCIKFLNYYAETNSEKTKMTIGLWNGAEHELSQLARDFKQKCIEHYESTNN